MKPFSPLYFIKENKARCILLMLMIFLSFGVYLGGLYVSNPLDNWKLPIESYEKMTTVSPAYGDEDYSQYEAFLEELEKTGKVILLPMGEYNGLSWKSIMGFETGQHTFTFCSVEDFRTFCEYMDIDCDFSNLKSGSLVMSDWFVRNQNLELGTVIDKNYDMDVYGSYTLDAVTDEEGYTLYFINEEPTSNMRVMLLGNGISGSELYELIYETQEKYNVSVYDNLEEQMEEQFQTFNLIYTFVVVLLSVILAITINAAFVGMYQRRNFEFAVYRAIGISKRRIVGKIVGELLWMDLITLVIGGAVFFVGVYLFNHLVLYPAGKYLAYVHPLAIFGLLLCNATVLVPLIVTRCRQLLKADICEY